MQNVLNEVKSFCERINYNPIPNKASPYKESHGEVYTPLDLIYHMLNNLPLHTIKDPYIKYLDTGAGLGNFSLVLYFVLRSQNIDETHIIENMLHMIEINIDNTKQLERMFYQLNMIYNKGYQVNANIYNNNFLNSYQHNTLNMFAPNSFDVIYGNPPYNISGKIKTPTNNSQMKTNDGTNAWVPFVRRAYELLKPNGKLLYIIPSIWCKPDKAKIYELFTQQFQIDYLEFYSNTETNKIFSSQAQTPTVIVMATKLETPHVIWRNQSIPIFDSINKHKVTFTLHSHKAIPTNGFRIIEKLQNMIRSHCSIMQYITKTSMPPISTTFIDKQTITHPNANINSAIISNRHTNPKIIELVIKYSNIPLAFKNQKKLIIPHKMYGLPYYDISGCYGISNRDNYVFILPELLEEFYEHYQIFLSTKLVQFILSCSRYRMMVIEKHIFDYIPQIHKIIKINRYNPKYSHYYKNNNNNEYNKKRLKEIEVKLVMDNINVLLTKEEALYIDNNFHNYTYVK